LLSIVLLRFHSTAQPQWQLLGLENEAISALTIDRAPPNFIYAGSTGSITHGTAGGVFRSANDGATWDTLLRIGDVVEVIPHPHQRQTVYVASRFPPLVLKTLDGGVNWFRADSGIRLDFEEGPIALTMNPSRPETLYCGTGGQYGGSLYKTTNGGAFWFPLHCDSITPPIPPCAHLQTSISAIELDRQHPETLYVGTGFGSLVKSTDGGQRWLATGLNRTPEDDMAIDPFDNQKVYAGVTRRGLWRSTNSGTSWQRLPLGLPDTILAVFSIAFSEQRLGELYCGWGWAGRFQLSRSVDGGFTWTSLEFPGVAGKLAVSPDRNTLYVGSFAGVYRKEILLDVTEDELIQNDHHLFQNFPNPFNGATIIRFRLAREGMVDLRIYDALGREVRRIAHNIFDEGEHSVSFESDGLASGVYFYSFSSRNFFAMRPMVVLR